MCQWMSNVATQPQCPATHFDEYETTLDVMETVTLNSLRYGSQRKMSKQHLFYIITIHRIWEYRIPAAPNHMSPAIFQLLQLLHRFSFRSTTHNCCSKAKSTSLMSKIETCGRKRFFPLLFNAQLVFSLSNEKYCIALNKLNATILVQWIIIADMFNVM